MSRTGQANCRLIVRFSSVITKVFKAISKAGEPITVTHKEITRFFMTIPEAASLVIQAGSMAKGGDVFVLDMGAPVKIVDLATRMIQLSGFELQTDENPDGDIRIQFAGLRPAEKLYEELLLGEDVTGTNHSMIMRANEHCLDSEILLECLLSLEEAIKVNNYDQLRQVLIRAVSGYKPYGEFVDHFIGKKVVSDDPANVVKIR